MTLQRYMKENKIKTKTLHEKTGIDIGYLGQIRAGFRRPSPDKAKLISDAIGIPVLDLLFPGEVERQDSIPEMSESNQDEFTKHSITTG